MNTLGFFVCWIGIGVFVILTLPAIMENWQKHHYDEKHQTAINKDISDHYKAIAELGNIARGWLVSLVMAVVYFMVIMAWPLTVGFEFAYRRRAAKKTKDEES